MKKFFLNNWPLILLFVLSSLVIWPLFISGYFSHHDNLQVIRILEMRKCFADLQIPCRWVPDMGFGNGYPLFNFYGPLPYYVGAIVSYILGYIGAAKFLFFLPLVFGAVGMYLLGKELFGKIPGTVSAILYLFAPYRALDSYVRGAIGESFALATVPFVFYLLLRLIKTKNRKYFVLATFATFLFFVSHNIMTLIFTPFIIIWILFWLYKEKWSGLKITLLSLGLAFGLSAFFIFPAFFEKGLVQTEALTRAELDFRAQFVKVSQLFIDRSWNYAGSQPQSTDTISYQIGWPHWWLVVLSLFGVLFSKKRKNVFLFSLLLSMFVAGVFMTHNKSAPIWEVVKILAYVQFPWRFLSVVIFSASLLGGYFVSLIKGRWVSFTVLIIISSTILLNWQYFRPEHFYYGLTDSQLLSGQSFVDQQAGALLDYLPKTALEPRELAPTSPFFVQGSGLVNSFINDSNRWEFNAETTKDASIVIPVFDFPNWTVLVNNNIFPHDHNNILGRIEINLPKGNYQVNGVFRNTPIRTFANILTLVSIAGVLLVIKYGKSRKIFI
jgi:6-pyruvoyl-tetrahydropterin synthase related domain